MKVELAPRNQSSILFDRNLTDLLKFIACMMVAMSHYSGYAIVSGNGNFIYNVIAATGGYIGVALFFFFSGYGLMVSDQKKHLGLLDFLKRRLSKTYLPAVLVSAIWLALNLVIEVNWGGQNLLCNQHYLLGVIWWFNDEVMWFIRVIIILYLCFYLYRYISIKWLKDLEVLELVMLIAFGAVSSLVVLYTKMGDWISLPFFFIGLAIARWPKRAKKIFRSFSIIMLMVTIMAIVAYLGRSENRVLHGVINYFVILCLVSFLAFVNITIKPLPKWIGGCSYDIYLVHYKTHLLLVFLCGVDMLWMFVLGTALSTTVFYNIRRLCKL